MNVTVNCVLETLKVLLFQNLTSLILPRLSSADKNVGLGPHSFIAVPS